MGDDVYIVTYERVGGSDFAALVKTIGYETENGFYYIDETVIDDVLEETTWEELYEEFKKNYKELTGYETDRSFDDFVKLMHMVMYRDEYLGYDYMLL